MEQFFSDLQPVIVTAVRHAMEKIHQEIGDEHIYSAALVTLFGSKYQRGIGGTTGRSRRRRGWRSCGNTIPRSW